MAESETETEASEQQRQSIARCMPFVPDQLNINERDYLMNMLYDFGIVSTYLTAVDNADDDGLGEDGLPVKFSNYFDFYDEGNGYIKIDPDTGRVTHLHLFKPNFYFDDEDEDNNDYVYEHFPIDVPPTIDQFQNLESITIEKCQSLTKKLSNLPFLREIDFERCLNNMFADIPKGLQLPHTKKVESISSNFDSNLSSFLKIFPALEELHFYHTSKDQLKEVLRVLQNDDLCFRQSLTTIKLCNCSLNGADFIRLMYTVRDRFPNLHTLDISCNNVESFTGIHDTIKSPVSALATMPNYKLRKLDLVTNGGFYLHFSPGENDNPITKYFLNNKDSKSNAKVDPKEKSALLTLLGTFQGISNLGLNPDLNYRGLSPDSFFSYDQDIENVLRINHAGRKFITSTTRERQDNEGTGTIINPALWPVILERAYKRSDEIYEFGSFQTKQQRDKMKCATGLFDLVRFFGSKFLINRGSMNMPTSKGKRKPASI